MYPFTISQLKEEIKLKQLDSEVEQGNGSDSDPCKDEMNMNEKLTSFIPVTIAKSMGLLYKFKKSEQKKKGNKEKENKDFNLTSESN